MCRGWSRHQHSPSPTCRPAQPSWQIHLGNQQLAKERVKLRRLQTADFNFISVALHSVWFLLSDCLSDGRLSRTISKPRSFPPQKPAQQFDALLLSPGLSWDHPPRMKTKVVRSKGKGKDWKLLQYSSMDKSWGQGHLPHCPWSWMERCRLPWSCHPLPSGCSECRCNIKHQLMMETSYLVMETHASSTPVQLCATCLCLPKSKAKEHGHCQKKNAKAFDNYLAKDGCLEDPFSKQTLRNYQPCVSTPKTPEHHKERVNQKNTVNHNSCPRFLSYNLGGTSHEQQWHPSSYACSTLAVSLKRWDVEAGTIKRTSQRNKGMAEKHAKSLV